MESKVFFELKSKDFFNGKNLFINKLTYVIKSVSFGCLIDGGCKYSLDVFVSNGKYNQSKSLNSVYRCDLNLCCDKKTNSESFSDVYDDVLRLLIKEYSAGVGFLYDNKYGVVYNHLTFCVTRHKLNVK
jgi:hypothetical protein